MTVKLTEIDVIQRTLLRSPADIDLLLEYLKMDKSSLSMNAGSTEDDAKKIASYLRKMGSHDLATLYRGEGVPYSEVVLDVGKKLGVKVSSSNSDEQNEIEIIQQLFAESFDRLTDDEKRDTLKLLNLTGSEIPYGAAGTLVAQVLLKQCGGFTVYKVSLIVANFVARAILGRGLTFAANAALTRSIGAFLGPIGWIASGLWLALDLAGPAYRKTIPSIVHMAALRQIIKNHMSIGVVGDGSTGKDSLFKAVFGIDTNNISPVSGSTKTAETYHLGDNEAISIVNFPGFNDHRGWVNSSISNTLGAMDLFLLVVDVDRGVGGSDVNIFKEIDRYRKPRLVCLNKIDKLKAGQKDILIEKAKERLKSNTATPVEIISTAFDPDERLYSEGPIGADEVVSWVVRNLRKLGKNTDGFGYLNN